MASICISIVFSFHSINTDQASDSSDLPTKKCLLFGKMRSADIYSFSISHRVNVYTDCLSPLKTSSF